MWELFRGDQFEPLEPAGFSLAAWALDELLSLLGDGRTVLDTRLLDEYGPLPLVKANRRERISDIVYQATARFAEAAFAGLFATSCRAFSGGPLVHLSADTWGIDDCTSRLARSSLNPERPFDPEAEPTHWLFVDSKSFSWWIDDVRIELGEDPRWQRAFDLGATIDNFPKPGFHHIPRIEPGQEIIEESNGRRRGAPQAYDWEQFLREIIRIAHTDPDGLPINQSALKERMLEWCVGHWGKEPSDSRIREKISEVYLAIGVIRSE